MVNPLKRLIPTEKDGYNLNYDIETFFNTWHNKVQELRTELLFGGPDDKDMTPEAAQFYLLAVASLEQAQRYLFIAGLKSKV